MNHTFQIIPLTVEARGEVISSNIVEYRELVRQALSSINRDLKTDEQFGQAELDAKALKEAEEAVKAAKNKALADAESLHELFAAMDATSEEIRTARLDLENQIKKRKDEVRTEIMETSIAQLDIDPRDARKHFLPGFQSAIKGKRTIETMTSSCNEFRIEIQNRINESRSSIQKFTGKFGSSLVPDKRELELKERDAVEAELLRRYEANQAAEEAAKLKAELAQAKATMAPSMSPTLAPSLTEDEEWKEMEATVKASFAMIKQHRDRLTHPTNATRISTFGTMVNQAWKEVKNMEVSA
jgi:hypothetical protein